MIIRILIIFLIISVIPSVNAQIQEFDPNTDYLDPYNMPEVNTTELPQLSEEQIIINKCIKAEETNYLIIDLLETIGGGSQAFSGDCINIMNEYNDKGYTIKEIIQDEYVIMEKIKK